MAILPPARHSGRLLRARLLPRPAARSIGRHGGAHQRVDHHFGAVGRQVQALGVVGAEGLLRAGGVPAGLGRQLRAGFLQRGFPALLQRRRPGARRLRGRRR